MKKLFTFLIALVASANMMFAESGTCGENLTWDLTDGVLTIAGSGAMTDFENNTYAPWNGYSSLIQSVVIRDSVTTVGNYAFAFCSNLSTISLGDSLISIGEYAFFSCTLLGGATIPDKVITIGDYAFANCDRLSSVELGESVESIGDYVFNRCVNLSIVTLSERVKSIGEYAFVDCVSLTSVTIPNSITSIGDYAFALCTGLTSVTCEAIIPPTCGENVFYEVDKSACVLNVPQESIEAYKKADGWKEFENIEAIEPLTETVTVAQALEIGQGLEVKETFETDLAIVGYVVGVETEFDSQKRNQTYWIADTQYGKATGALYVYRGACDQEVKRGYKVSIQGKITRYTDLVIETVEKAQVTILDETETDEATILMGKCGAEGDSTNLSWQLNLSTWTLDIQGSGPMADSLKYLPWHSQNYRNSITSVNLPDGLTTIGLGAFEYCKKLTSITIPETVNLIGKWAFYNCTNLTSVNIPESVHAFGLYAFVGIAVPQPLMNSHFFCFMPREYSGKYTIPEGITNIISFAFERCVQLTEVIIPSSAKDLGYSAFGSCTALQSITSLAANPPACREEMSFKDVDKSIPLYVPAESLDAYKAADEWKDFTNIQPIQAEEVPVTEIEAEPTYNSVVIEWPKVDEAMVYTIEIRKDGELICTLTFNEQGQLQGITFAKPSRNGGRNSQVRMAIQTATGWQYTISGLDPDTEYTYSVVAKKNASDTETLYSESISFTTKQAPTGIDEILDSSNPAIMKFIRDGQLYILREGEIYNATGVRVE